MDARAALKRATHDAHERIHSYPAFCKLHSGTLTIASYRLLLARLYGFHLPLEQAIVSSAQEWRFGIDVERCRRVRRLVRDLRFLGASAADLDALPLAPPPRIGRPGDFLGALYVHEGAILGGKVMAGKLDWLLGAGRHGRSFLAGTKRDRGGWRGCCEALERGRKAGHLSDMVAAACGTFTSFELWMKSTEARLQDRA